MGADWDGGCRSVVRTPHDPRFFGDTPIEHLRFSGATFDTSHTHSLMPFIHFFTSYLLSVDMCQALFEVKGIHTVLNRTGKRKGQ